MQDGRIIFGLDASGLHLLHHVKLSDTHAYLFNETVWNAKFDMTSKNIQDYSWTNSLIFCFVRISFGNSNSEMFKTISMWEGEKRRETINIIIWEARISFGNSNGERLKII